MRQRVADWLESSFVRNGIIAVIVFNAVILGFETSQGMMNAAGGLIHALDRLCLSIFVIEREEQKLAPIFGPLSAVLSLTANSHSSLYCYSDIVRENECIESASRG